MPRDKVRIVDLAATGIIGIKPDERVTPQEILVNATLWVDTARAAASDDISDAANYRTIAKALIAHVERGEPMLVERLVQELADLIFAIEPLADEVEVSVEKPGALRHARSVGITIHRSRVDKGQS
jgi:FolB domain-containing protein